MSSDNTFGGPSGANNSTIEYEETAKINGVVAKKVWNLDSNGNLITPATSTAQTDGSQKTQIVDTIPTDSNHLNGSLVLTYNASNQVTNITKTINTVQYQKTISWTGDVATAISAWVQL